MTQRITLLTGAGISAESGLGTFRDEDGLWAKHRIEDVATPEGFARDPMRVHAFYNARREQAATAQPNAAHHALARLAAADGVDLTVITQNVDGLHEMAGLTDVIHMHGVLSGALCAACDHRWTAPPQMDTQTACPACAAPAARPDVVWFGEMPYRMEDCLDAIAQTDLFVAIGTSGHVYPAAGFVQEARMVGARTLELNLDPSEVVSQFDAARFGPASQIVPDWVDEVLATL